MSVSDGGIFVPYQVSTTQWTFSFFGFFCFLFIALFILSILIAVWVYRDAESRGMSGVLWLLVVLVGGIIGLIIYLIVRHDRPVGAAPAGYSRYSGYGAYPWYAPPPSSAPQAGTGGPSNCKVCGGSLTADGRFWPNCGSRVV